MERRLRARLTEVERDNRRLRARTTWMALVVLGVVAFLGVQTLRPDLFSFVELEGGRAVVEAHEIVLLDSEDRPRGGWVVDPDGNVRLTLLDQEDRPRLSLSVLEGGFPGLSLINTAGQRRVALGLLPDETTSLVFADPTGIPRAVLGLTRGDAANLVFADGEGVTRIGLGLDASGFGTVMLPADSADGSGG